MNRRTKRQALVSTACIGAAAGTAAMLIGARKDAHKSKKSQKMRRNAGKALRQVGVFVENVAQMMQ
jgi:hypothetical protein